MFVLAPIIRLLVVMLPPADGSLRPPSLMAQLTDGTIIGVSLLDDRLPLSTPHGQLMIPAREVRRLHIAPRLTDEERRGIEQAIKELGSLEVTKREEAAAKLRKLGQRAYPFVIRAIDDPDRELALSARKLRDQFLQHSPNQTFVPHDLDVVWTEDGKYAGRLEIAALRLRTTAFGGRILKLKDIVGLSPPAKLASTAPPPTTPNRNPGREPVPPVRRGR